MSRRIVLDTNCLLQAISRRSRFYPIWRDFIQGRYDLCVTTEILAEYEEILSRHTSPVVVDCSIVANAEYIVTDDAHFDVLKDIPFPRVLVMTAESFLAELEQT